MVTEARLAHDLVVQIATVTDEHQEVHPRRAAERIVAEALGMSEQELRDRPGMTVPASRMDAIRDLLVRSIERPPRQYEAGGLVFRGMELRIRPGVFLPRTGSIHLVDMALDALRGIDEPRVIDLCTGSGVLGLGVAHENASARVWAVDIVPVAVETARENAERLGMADRVTVFEGDLFDPLPDSLLGAADVVMANAPYVPSDLVGWFPVDLEGSDPAVSADGGPDGLALVRRVIESALDWMAPGGTLMLEVHHSRCEVAGELAERIGFVDVQAVTVSDWPAPFLTARVPGGPAREQRPKDDR